MRDGKQGGFAIVTGASSGIGLELARIAAKHGYDLLIASDGPEINDAATQLRNEGVNVETVECDLSQPDGVEQLYEAAQNRPVDLLFANAGRGLGHAFLDEDIEEAMDVVNTNISGTTLAADSACHRSVTGTGMSPNGVAHGR